MALQTSEGDGGDGRAPREASVPNDCASHTLRWEVRRDTVAIMVAAAELAVISYIRHRYMDTPFLAAAFQVVVGGMLVFLTGIVIGSS